MFSKETKIARIDYRIRVLRERGEVMNQRLIAALMRERRNLEYGKVCEETASN